MREVIARSSIAFLLMFLAFGLSIKPSFAYEQTTYSLQVTLNASCGFPFLPFQTVSSAVVSFELKNIGNETFDGVLTLEAKTDKGHPWNALKYTVSNLTKNAVYTNSTSYASVDAGLYYFTLKVEPNNTLSDIKLYQDSNLLSEGFRVSTNTSIFFHSFSEFIAIVAIVVGAIVAIAVGVYTAKKKK
jgi:hypothetical protein